MMIKKVAALHDVSAYGRSSLTVVIPVISAMGICVCPIPTALLSSSTSFEDPYILDLTPHIELILQHWRKMNLSFDAIYSGFLGSAHQCKIIEKMLNDFANENCLVLVDPVMGDNGSVYESIQPDFIPAMKQLIKKANIITPNITEACLLLDEPYRNNFSDTEIKKFVLRLAECGPPNVIITGITNSQRTKVAVYSKKEQKFEMYDVNYIPCDYPGTGDTFASIVCGSVLQGKDLFYGVQIAMNYIYKTIAITYESAVDKREGILQELTLHCLPL